MLSTSKMTLHKTKQNVINTILCTDSIDHNIYGYINHVKVVFYLKIGRKNNQHLVIFKYCDQ